MSHPDNGAIDQGEAMRIAVALLELDVSDAAALRALSSGIGTDAENLTNVLGAMWRLFRMLEAKHPEDARVVLDHERAASFDGGPNN
jgi:hypothetical protein